MLFIGRLYSWYGKTAVNIVLALILVLVVAALFFTATKARNTSVASDVLLPTVEVAPATTLGGDATIRLVGTVEAVSQAKIETETAGRITSVNVELGDAVYAGQVIAQLENASEHAAVLQAEGVYEAALAAGAVGDAGVAEAETAVQNAKENVVTALRSAFLSFEDIVTNDIDVVFNDPYKQFFALKIDGEKYTDRLIKKRKEFKTVLPEWQQSVNSLSTESDLNGAIAYAKLQLASLNEVLTMLVEQTSDKDNKGILSDTVYASLSSTYTGDKSTVSGLTSSITGAETALHAAEQALERTKIGSTGTDLSAANAQIKQALGALRAAQANLAKTVLRSPIKGTVNALLVTTGDFVGSFQRVAEIANNNALEITTYVGEKDREALHLDQEVFIEGSISGVVTNIAPAVDSVTKKIEVKIATEDTTLANGDTVTIALKETNGSIETSALFIPITAVKFTEKNGVVFSVEDNTLIAHPVEIGRIRGSFVEITGGIDPTEVIVIDARGRAAGQKVESVSN